MEKFICSNCRVLFKRYKSTIKTASPCCSYSCASILRKSGKYHRTLKHKQKMSSIISMLPHKKQRIILTEINKSRKGKTFNQIYGNEKTKKLLQMYGQRVSGYKNPNYIDGRSYAPYPIVFNRNLKKHIKTLDGYLCVGCGMAEDEAINKDILNRGLTIHHIDFNKNNCSEQNLITLCRGCNSRANFYREKTTVLYTQKIKERSNYATKS